MKFNKKIEMDKVIESFFFIILIIFIFSYMLIGTLGKEPSKLFSSDVVSLKDGWFFEDSQGIEKHKIPYTFKYNADNIIEGTKEIEAETIELGDKGCIVTSFGDFKIFIDDILVYQFLDTDFFEYKNKVNKKVHVFDIPKELKKEKIRVELNMHSGGASEATNFAIKNMFIGNENTVINKLFFGQWPIFVIALFTLFFGIILILVWIITNYKGIELTKEFLYIGMFGFFSPVYAFCSLNLCQIITDNSKLINTLSYMSLLLMPIPVVLIIISNLSDKYKKYAEICMYILSLNFFIQTILNFLEIFDYQKMLNTYHVIVVLLSVFIVSVIVIDMRRQVNKSNRTVIALLPILIGSIIDLILFQTRLSIHDGLFIQVGVILFIIMHSANVAIKFANHYKKSVKANAYEKLAYTDIMTSIGNRSAFEKTIKEINESLDYFPSIWVISIDLNILKFINDTKGHSEGDKLLTSFSSILRNTFQDVGTFYRTGGDEFFVIITDYTEQQIVHKIRILNKKIEKYNKTTDIKLSAALGYDKFKNHKDRSLYDVIVRADQLMYIDKRKKKEKLMN